MKHFTLAQIEKLVFANTMSTLPPKPFPGKNHPVRVAWKITLRTSAHLLAGESKVRTFSYIGKPHSYRAKEWLRHFQPNDNLRIQDYFEAEFDRNGLIAATVPGSQPLFTDSYWAYHPQTEANTGIAQNFTRPFYIKRIGKVPTYSLQKTLTQVQLDRYYAWWENTFNKPLKKPAKAVRKPKPPFNTIAIPEIGIVMNDPVWEAGEARAQELRRRRHAQEARLLYYINRRGMATMLEQPWEMPLAPEEL